MADAFWRQNKQIQISTETKISFLKKLYPTVKKMGQTPKNIQFPVFLKIQDGGRILAPKRTNLNIYRTSGPILTKFETKLQNDGQGQKIH